MPSDLITNYCSETTGVSQCDYFLNLAKSTEKQSYASGERVTVMVKLYYTNYTAGNATTNATATEVVQSAMFFPRVDEYSKLIIPDSYNKLEQFDDVTIGFEFIYNASRWILPRRKWFQGGKYIQYRTVVLSLFQGAPMKIEWETTKCYYEACGCLDNLCPVTCDNRANCNVEIHLGWAGTDSNKRGLESSLKSIYKLKNVI